MRAVVRKGMCPECFTGEETWIVRGPDGDCWTCSRDWNTALRYAIGRVHQEQPGTGDQVRNTVTK